MQGTLRACGVKAVSACLPQQTLDLRKYASVAGITDIEKVIKTTGISNVRIAPSDRCTSDYCYEAASAILSTLELSPDCIDGLIFVSQTPDYILPASSAVLHEKLGLSQNCYAIDINQGCCGFIVGLSQACLLVSSGICKKVLVCVGDTLSRHLNDRDRSVRTVFGDGGAAALVEPSASDVTFAIKMDGSRFRDLIIPAGGARIPRSDLTKIAKECENGNFRSLEDLYMNGLEIMNFAMRSVKPIIEDVLVAKNWSKAEVDFFVLHQANKFMLDYLRKKIQISEDAMPICLDGIGNTGPATIPVLLSAMGNELRQGKAMQKVVLCGFGVGLTWGAVAINLSDAVFIAPTYIA
ncbi:ketoacyl-ACP synthase III [Erysipelotrichia bacterium]